MSHAIPTTATNLTQEFWVALGPTAWPAPPSPMSFSTLRDIEGCPRRWALRRATYAFNVEKSGYPQRLSRAAVAGAIVHRALERVVAMMKETRNPLVRSNPKSEATGEPSPDVNVVFQALRALGGISNLLDGVLSDLAQEWVANPRVKAHGQELKAEMRRELPSLRERVKHLLQNIDTKAGSSDWPNHVSRVTSSNSLLATTAQLGVREPVIAAAPFPGPAQLGPGLHSEVPLFNAELDWFGKADLIRIADDECSIVDFKTGVEKEDHYTQILAYALLWIRDERVNPRRIPVTNLSVVYSDKTVVLDAPDSAETKKLAKDLAKRSGDARQAVSLTPPPALPSREECEWCDVRQLCSVYWDAGTRRLIDAAAELRSLETFGIDNAVELAHLADLELGITARQGEWSWHARILQTGALTKEFDVGSEVLLRARPGDHFAGTVVSQGMRVRVIGAHIVDASEESANRPVAILGRSSEVFKLL